MECNGSVGAKGVGASVGGVGAGVGGVGAGVGGVGAGVCDNVVMLYLICCGETQQT